MLFFKNYLLSLKTFFNVKSIKTLSLKKYLKIYKSLNKLRIVNFNVFSEASYALSKFECKALNMITLYVYFYKNYLLSNLSVGHYSRFKNNRWFDLFESFDRVFIRRIILKIIRVKVKPLIINSSKFLVRYSPTNVAKYLHSSYINRIDVLFLRKNKVFNKGRYSRNRQFYRTGVYWCIYINLIAIIGLYFWFYRFVINFGYLWWLLFISLFSFLLAKSFNYGLLTPSGLFNSIFSNLTFFGSMFLNMLNYLLATTNIIFSRLFSFNFLDIEDLFNEYFQKNSWVLLSVLRQFNLINLNVYLWRYNRINYYIHSITLNYNRVFLDTKKHRFFTEFLIMFILK